MTGPTRDDVIVADWLGLRESVPDCVDVRDWVRDCDCVLDNVCVCVLLVVCDMVATPLND